MFQQNIKQENIFQTYYNQLNPQQKKAVDTLEGPVMVNAGPGTGKTQILATRIGNILLNTDTQPENILCLTYTDNGVVEMRKRLLKIVGAAAYKIAIHTYHSFCNEVIQENKSLFGMYQLDAISDLEEAELLNKLIDNIDSDSVLKKYTGEIYFSKDNLKNLFSLMRKEAYTADFLNERIDTYIQELSTKEGFIFKRKQKEFSAGDPNPRLINAEIERMEKLRAGVNLFDTYNKMMRESHRYTFDDMILWVLDAFEKNKNLLLNYQERYLYFLIDEFQDTSRSQNLIAQHLTSYWDNPNIFVVGDADQSIFSFQDANVENIIHFEKKYGNDLTKIDLINNYRSTQNILDAAFSLISHNKLRTVQKENNHPLKASNNEIANLEIIPVITEYPNPIHESVGVAIQIEALLKSGVNGNDIAVIYKNHKHAQSLISILQKKEIPINVRKAENALDIPIIENLISILNWIEQENTIPYSGEDLLFKILHFNFFNTQPSQVAKLCFQVNENKKGKKMDQRPSLRSTLAELKKVTGTLFDPADNSLKEVSNTLELLIQESHNVTLQHLLELTVQRTGMLQYIMLHEEKPFLLQALSGFFNSLKDLSSKNPTMNLHDFLTALELMQKNNISIPVYKIINNQNGVHFITAHSSKGSEYKYVFIINAIEKAWDKESGTQNRYFKYPDNLVKTAVNTDDLEEKRRLFYVAATRAKTNLYISFSESDNKNKAQTQSCFITEICEGQPITITKKSIEDEIILDFIALEWSENAKPKLKEIEADFINEKLKNYSLSVTHLNNYLSCPLKFYYNNLIKVPSAKNENMAFGSAIHFTLQRLFEKMKENKYQFSSSDEMVNDFLWYMNRNKEAFTTDAYNRRIEYGKKILPPYYETHIQNWHKNVMLETNINNIHIDGIPLNGKLDKLEIYEHQIKIIDYKTGKHSNAKKKLNAPVEKDPNGGDYWRQAVFYKILMDNSPNNSKTVHDIYFDFIEPEKDAYKTEKVTVSPADITTVTQQIKEVWQKIQEHDFYTGCGKPTCEWCHFIKNNQLYSDIINEDDDLSEDIG